MYKSEPILHRFEKIRSTTFNDISWSDISVFRIYLQYASTQTSILRNATSHVLYCTVLYSSSVCSHTPVAQSRTLRVQYFTNRNEGLQSPLSRTVLIAASMRSRKWRS